MTAIKLKDDDKLVSVVKDLGKSIFVSQNGYYLNIDSEEIPVVGPKASGVKGINLKDDILVAGLSYDNQEYVNVFTDKKTAKRVKISDLETMSRAKKGSLIIKKTKTVTYLVQNALVTNSKDIISIKSDNEIKDYKNSDISIMDLASTGSSLTKHAIEATLLKVELESFLKKNKELEKTEEKKEEVKEPQYKEMTLDDFIDGFKL
jgi:topoisomerase-4 subunit A